MADLREGQVAVGVEGQALEDMGQLLLHDCLHAHSFLTDQPHQRGPPHHPSRGCAAQTCTAQHCLW